MTHRKILKAVGPNPIILYFPDPVALQYLRTLQLTLGDIFSEFMPAERTEQMEWADTLKSHLLKEGMTTPTVIQVSFSELRQNNLYFILCRNVLKDIPRSLVCVFKTICCGSIQLYSSLVSSKCHKKYFQGQFFGRFRYNICQIQHLHKHLFSDPSFKLPNA